MTRLQTARAWLVGSVLLFPTSALAQYYGGGFNPRAPQQSFESMMLEERIKQHLLSAIIGALVGAFFSEKLKKFRVWFFVIGIALSILAGAIASTTGGNVAAFIAGAVVAYLALRDKLSKDQEKAAKPTTFGSAEWADLEHLQQNGLTENKGFVLGFFEANTQSYPPRRSYPLHYAGDRHLLTIRPYPLRQRRCRHRAEPPDLRRLGHRH